MISLAYETAGHFGKAALLLDRLFLTVPALLTLAESTLTSYTVSL